LDWPDVASFEGGNGGRLDVDFEIAALAPVKPWRFFGLAGQFS
jgi:hypothetical protein